MVYDQNIKSKSNNQISSTERKAFALLTSYKCLSL